MFSSSGREQNKFSRKLKQNQTKPQAGWLTPVISVEPEDHEIEASLGYIVRPCLSKQTRNLIFQCYSREKKMCCTSPGKNWHRLQNYRQDYRAEAHTVSALESAALAILCRS